ncbi:hypothetical protein [Marivivens sp.]|jgi:hypothetical protein|uniref:hypothetical protein n=1 Tax=Marivivens sp. TaxID=1978374 RepID=UPI0017D5FE50|nr:hypothetical protein [Marivivens sp.]MCL7406541.1 hypothetical protein [Marivivens geojensis]NVJ95958.1 hypothetical protein [Marivivens sp.]
MSEVRSQTAVRIGVLWLVQCTHTFAEPQGILGGFGDRALRGWRDFDAIAVFSRNQDKERGGVNAAFFVFEFCCFSSHPHEISAMATLSPRKCFTE